MPHLEEHTPGLVVAVQHAVLQVPPPVGEHEHRVQLATAQDSCQGTAHHSPGSTEDEKKKKRNATTTLKSECSFCFPIRFSCNHCMMGATGVHMCVGTWSSWKQWGCSFSDVFSASHSSHASTSSVS